MDSEKIWKQRQFTEDWLHGVYFWGQHFVKTSEHPSWQGKVRCRYCKRTGWPDYNADTSQANPVWWGKKHGPKCKWKELYDLKNRSSSGLLGNNWYAGNGSWGSSFGTITYATNTASTYYIKTP